ncbi:MAG: prolipoprotein diacylglyceryl transferase family protein [Chloroflexota bacterium]|nr:prolipoprotein diacylglyceryl transferase family protein [Chloroflexota bacterium]
MNIGPWVISNYTLRISSAFLAGLFWVWLLAPRHGYSRAQVSGALWIITGGALLGGRLGYALTNAAYFTQRPLDLCRWRQVGGEQGWAVWLGGLLAAWLWTKWRSESWDDLLRLLTPAALLITAGSWWGCAAAGCAWGREAPSAPKWLHWAVVEAPDLYQTSAPRYAVQLAGTSWALCSAGAAMLWNRYSVAWLALYMGGAALLTYFQANPVPLVCQYRLDFIIALILTLFFLCQQAWMQINTEKDQKSV